MGLSLPCVTVTVTEAASLSASGGFPLILSGVVTSDLLTHCWFRFYKYLGSDCCGKYRVLSDSHVNQAHGLLGKFVVWILNHESVFRALKAKWILLKIQYHLFSLQWWSCLMICHLIIFQREFIPRLFFRSKLFIEALRQKYLKFSGKEKTDITLRVLKEQFLKCSMSHFLEEKKSQITYMWCCIKKKDWIEKKIFLNTVGALCCGSRTEKTCT